MFNLFLDRPPITSQLLLLNLLNLFSLIPQVVKPKAVTFCGFILNRLQVKSIKCLFESIIIHNNKALYYLHGQK